MHDLKNLLPIPIAVERVTGTRLNLSTTWRWSTKGVKGIRLETVIIGGRRLTSVEMVEAFIAATTEARNASYPITASVAPTKSREKQMAKASADLHAKLHKQKRTKARA